MNISAGIHFVVEREIKKYCPYCKGEHSAKLCKEFYLNYEYLTGSCDNCGHELWMRTN